jgi:Leucine-rich repeat (LRR) protein
LYQNGLDWKIPTSINNLAHLAHLDLSNNAIISPFPEAMGELTRLRYLFVGDNPFEKHDMPPFLQKLTKLRELSMKKSNLTGAIPAFFAGLTNLQLLDLDQNQLTGSIPEELGLLSGLDILMLNRNKLTGTLPDTFALMHDLGE